MYQNIIANTVCYYTHFDPIMA